jgi:hypothetical protein
VARGKGVTANPAFQIRWRDVTQVAQDLTTGMTEAEAARAARAERPLFVFIHDADATTGSEDDSAFQDERVAVGARFFDCVRISRADAKEDRLLAPHAGKAPALLLVRPSYEVVSVQPARFNANKVFEAMCATMKKDYKNCAQTVLKKQREIEKERAALAREKEKLAKLEEEATASGARAKVEKLKEQLVAAEAALGTEEDALYRLEPKDAEKIS